jgi:tetratricopeptide (TPR) repeat protein
MQHPANDTHTGGKKNSLSQNAAADQGIATAEACHRNGLILKTRGKLNDAVVCFQKAVRLKPEFAEAYNNLGNALYALGQINEALENYKQAIQHKPTYAEAFYNLANCLSTPGELKAAIDNYKKAIELKPEFAEAYCNLGLAFKGLGNFEAAAINFECAISIKPDSAEALNNYGNLLNDTGKFEEAIDKFKRAIKANPEFTEAYSNLGISLGYIGRTEEAIEHFNHALKRQPDYADARWNRSLALLACGHFREGFEEYEWRFRQSNWTVIYPYRYELPRWDGSEFSGKRLYIHDEQGLGDTLQFLRYLPYVKKRGGKIIFEAKKPIHGLLANYPWIDELVERSADGIPAVECDMFAPLMSLAAIFKTTLETIPDYVPYIFADPEKVAAWRRRLRDKKYKIGIVWAGRLVNANDPVGLGYRSCELKCFKPLAAIPDIQLYGLQKGEAAAEAMDLSRSGTIVNLGEAFDDFSDTAAAIANLDLVISIDTSVAHLAGAMGRPVWLLLPFAADWRWLKDRSDSPWYPTMRIFRQHRLGQWDTAFYQVAHEISKFSLQMK